MRLIPVFAVLAMVTVLGCPGKAQPSGGQTCSADARVLVDRGFFLLHAFEYDWARLTFRSAVEADPECALAHCGEALSYNETIWIAPSQTDLAHAWAAVERAREAAHVSQKERRFIGAVARLFRDHSSVPKKTRDVAYTEAMEELHSAFPDDVEIGTFYALSLLGLSGSQLGKDLTHELEAEKVLWPYFEQHQDHAGVTHYLIHALDATPELARRAMPAARLYAKIAPGVPHAQHMPAHIYFRLGMWDEGMVATLASDRASRELLELLAWPAAKRDLHNAGWKTYAYLQLGRFAEARAFLDEIGQIATDTGDLRAGITFLVMRYRFLIESGRWDEALSAQPVMNTIGEALTLGHVKALAGAFTGDLEAAEAGLAVLRQREPESVRTLQSAAAIAMARGELDRMEQLMQQAVRLEQVQGSRGYMPMPPIPIHELLGEMLLFTGQPERAREEFTASLRVRLNRPASLFGLGKSAALAGDRDAARTHLEAFLRVWSGADADLVRVREAEKLLNDLL